MTFERDPAEGEKRPRQTHGGTESSTHKNRKVEMHLAGRSKDTALQGSEHEKERDEVRHSQGLSPGEP